MNTEEILRAKFADLTKQQQAITAKLDPLRDELDALVAGDTKLSVKAANAREAELREQIRALQNELFPIEQERAMCVRAVGGGKPVKM